MKWTNEQIRAAITALYGNGGVQEQTVIPVMQKMRDDYEKAIKEMSKRIAVLEDMVDVQGDRISTALAANAELAAKVRGK